MGSALPGKGSAGGAKEEKERGKEKRKAKKGRGIERIVERGGSQGQCRVWGSKRVRDREVAWDLVSHGGKIPRLRNT